MKIKTLRRRLTLLYLQIAAAVISLILGIAQVTKEGSPVVRKIQENHHQNQLVKQQEIARKKALEISQMQISWQFKGHDNNWRYYSDPSGRFWARVNIAGVYEYCESPQHQMSSNNLVIR